MFFAALFLAAALVAVPQERSSAEKVQHWIGVIGTSAEGHNFEALGALIALGEIATEPCLVAMKDSSESVVRRWQCAMVLGRIGGSHALPALLEVAIDEPNDMIAAVALESIGRIGDKVALAKLEPVLKKKMSTRRREALESVLLQLGSSRVKAKPKIAWTQPPLRTGTQFV
ncbi:MAG: HEAT repeat domain-containing protein [bacterium]|nr:HEAT repeat domain-containing protein [bacterium]